MSDEILSLTLKKAFDFADREINIVFSGGEPAMAGLKFYKSAVDYIQNYNKSKNLGVNLFFRTNASLIDEEWAIFLKKYRFTVEISIDGYKEINDINRFDTKGAGSFNLAMKAYEMLKKHKVKCKAVFVVNRLAAKHGEKIYQFFKKNNFSDIDFIPCFDAGEKRGKSFYSLTPELYGNFLKVFFEKWKSDLKEVKNRMNITHFDNWTAMALGRHSDCCFQNGICDGKFVIEGDGSIHPCYLSVKDKGFGNIKDTDFDTISRSKSYIDYIEESFNICDKCKNCKYYKICRSGCKCDRVYDKKENGNISYFCAGYYEFFKVSSEGFSKAAYLLAQKNNRFLE